MSFWVVRKRFGDGCDQVKAGGSVTVGGEVKGEEELFAVWKGI